MTTGSPQSPFLVLIYSRPDCGFCQLAKSYLASQKVGFNEVDLSLNPERFNEVLELTGPQAALPLIVFAQKNFVVGFNRDQIDHYLRQYKLI